MSNKKVQTELKAESFLQAHNNLIRQVACMVTVHGGTQGGNN